MLEGVISDGEGDAGFFSEEGIGSEPMRRAMRIAARDDNIKAIVIRIDSPGGQRAGQRSDVAGRPSPPGRSR